MGKLWEPGERIYPRSGKNKYKNIMGEYRQTGRWPKLLWQTGVSLLIFIFIWGIFQFNMPLMNSVQGTIRSWFTEDYNIEPVIKFFSDVGLWGDTFDRAAYEAMGNTDASLDLTVPVSGQITRPFGWIISTDRSQNFHDGIVIAAPEGTPVRAALGGKISRIANEEILGRVVEITGEKEFVTIYAHCKEILVNLDDQISPGQVIARVGKTGQAEHSQLYFKIVRNDEPLDPVKFFIPASDKT